MRYLFRFLAICAAVAVLSAGIAFALVPQVADLVTANRSEAEPLNLDPPAERSYVYDRDGNVVTTLFYDQNRAPVPLSQVPSPVQQAIIATEDEGFYSHEGVNLQATLRALITNVKSGAVEQGGSTITMQLVKNTINRSERTLTRKTREAVLAYRLEQELTKAQILERYLNTVYFGNGSYGVQAAAETYWGKDVSQLDWPEAALLAALIRDPNDYDPFVNPKLATERRRIVLDRLVEVGDLTREQADQYAFTPLPTTRPAVSKTPVTRDYFTTEVVQRLLDDPAYGIGDDAQSRNAAVFQGGLRIYTTLDTSLQQKALDTRDAALPGDDGPGLFAIKGGRQDLATQCPNTNNGTNCLGTVAEASVEPSTGAVRMLVGGPGFETWKYDIATQGPRQPGSSMKTVVLLAALENGYTVNDTISGGKCSFPTPLSVEKIYTPTGHTTGTATLIRHLAGSINCAFVRLGQLVGIDKVIDMAKKLGVSSPLNNVVSLPLGPDAITPLEMTAAYAAIADDGVYNPPYFIDKITDAKGDVLYQHEANAKRAMSSESAREAIVALQAVVTGGTATNAKLADRAAAGKTGTTDRHGDAWFIGFTPQLATGVWMGNPETIVPLTNVGGIDVFGGTFPALIWHNYMTEAMAGLPALSFTAPSPSRSGKFLELPKGKEIGSGSSTPILPRAPTPTTAPPASGPPTTAAPAASPAPASPAPTGPGQGSP